jgi:thiamine biosynthesis lipoprotein
VSAAGTIRKAVPELQLNLSAVAKGYAADRIADRLGEFGCENVFVEIGGDVATRGAKSDGPWRVGIEVPAYAGGGTNAHQAVIELAGAAVATSGDYRNYFRDQGRAYSHILDPRTGRPVTNAVASVSVVAPTCADADGLATGLMVMGAKAGLRRVAEFPDVHAQFVVREAPGSFATYRSAGFPVAPAE